ncbi:hypothetical protein PMAYCL1PPCAC_25571, partial [Pristionchus mayeri]
LNERGFECSWNCKANVEFVLFARSSNLKVSKKGLATFDGDNIVYSFDKEWMWSGMSNPNSPYVINNKVNIEFHVDIISSEKGIPIDLTKFCSPSELNNVTLIFRDKKLLVSKDLLALYSPVFA